MVSGSKGENGARSDAAEENSAVQERAVRRRVYARNYRLATQWTGTIIKKGHEIMIYDVKVGKDTWIRHHNQLCGRLAEPIIDNHYLSLYSFSDTSNLIHVLPLRS
ncbi:unnamed protein product [Hymenolepis diminuta]|uniref:Uncharacterized protein n=1 Tax=Hymenolepis diminuta TaxID=6216 RepID=A0A564YBD0_HYMDI|nr:unnamed protein product [Hymenolepis diminuta]